MRPRSSTKISAIQLESCQHTFETPSLDHWVGVNWILRYLRGMTTIWLCLYNRHKSYWLSQLHRCWLHRRQREQQVHEDGKSMSRMLPNYWDCTVNWLSKKQTLTATSTANAQINSLALGLVEALWMRDIIREILGQPNSERPDLVLIINNQVCLANIEESLNKPRKNHLWTKFHWIREGVQNGSASMRYELTRSMLAVPLTKALDRITHLRFCK